MPYPWAADDTLTSAHLNAAFALAYVGLNNRLNADGTNLTGFTQGSVPFVGSGALVEDNANLFFDNTNKRLGIGTALPQVDLHVGTTAAKARVYNSFTDASNGEWSYLGSWGVTSNVATYGTGKNGSGVTRNVEVVIGGTRKLDYGIGTAATWTFVGDVSLSSGNLGIGGAPSVAFHVKEAGATTYTTTNLATGAVRAYLHNTDQTDTNFARLAFVTTDSAAAEVAVAGITGIITSHTAGAVSADVTVQVRNSGTVAEAAKFFGSGDFRPGAGSAIATNATVGFLIIPTCAGTPTGAPTNASAGQIPMVWDKTNLKLYVYTGGAWKASAAFT